MSVIFQMHFQIIIYEQQSCEFVLGAYKSPFHGAIWEMELQFHVFLTWLLNEASSPVSLSYVISISHIEYESS